MTKVQEAIERHMMATNAPREELEELLTPHRFRLLMSGEDTASLYETTLLAAYFQTSVRDFMEN